MSVKWIEGATAYTVSGLAGSLVGWCPVPAISSTTLTQNILYDGTNYNGNGCISNITNLLGYGPTGSALGTPASGNLALWYDSAGFPRSGDPSGNIYQFAKELASGSIRAAGGSDSPDAAATAAQMQTAIGMPNCAADGSHALTNPSGTMNCTSISGGSVSAGSQIGVSGSTVSFNPFDFSTIWGYDNFCFANVQTGYANWTSQMTYNGQGSSGIAGLGTTGCGVLLTTTATSGNTQLFSSGSSNQANFIIDFATEVTEFSIVFKTSDATNASFSFALGADNNVISGTSNGVAIQALGGGSYITLETCASFACTSTSSGVAYTANTEYVATLTSDGAGHVCIQVNSGSNVCTTTDVPTTIYGSGWQVGVKTGSNTAVTATVIAHAYRIPRF